MTISTSEAHQQARRLFDEIADDYLRRSSGAVYSSGSLILRRRTAIVESFIRCLGRPGGKALDYGMGPAVFAKCCRAAGMDYIGIDVSPEMVKRAQRARLSNCDFVVGDLDTLSSYREQMDLVLAIGVIEYLEDVADGISRLAACLKPRGHLVLSFRNRYSLPSVLRAASKAVLRPLARRSAWAKQNTAFADVRERSFDVTTDLAPRFRALGLEGLELRYFNCSPVFFNFPVPGFLWRGWYLLDGSLARPATRLFCAGAVVALRKPAS